MSTCRLLLIGAVFPLLLGLAVRDINAQDKTRGVQTPENAAAEPAMDGRYLVATIGIDAYDHWLQLDNAVGDAAGLQQVLVGQLGFTNVVDPLYNDAATRDGIMKMVDEDLPALLEPDDNLILFFAGHGHTRSLPGGREVGYLIPVGAEEDDRWSTYVELETFLRTVGRLPARHIIVILDACHSGLALGDAAGKSRSSYTADLHDKRSRWVITSAQRDQLALDTGPVPGHSLFTGTLIDGITGGTLDDGDGLITSSEIASYLQKQVGNQALRLDKHQTPGFGTFQGDDEGQMVISLQNNSFAALRSRAENALQRGRFAEFEELARKLSEMAPEQPEVLYLNYRLALHENRIDDARMKVEQLLELEIPEGAIPLSADELYTLRQRLHYFRHVLSGSGSSAGTEIRFGIVDSTTWDGGEAITTEDVIAQEPVAIGETSGFHLEKGQFFHLQFGNPTGERRHLAMIGIDQDGRIEPMPAMSRSGIDPGQTVGSYPFQIFGLGLNELRVFVSPHDLSKIAYPPSARSRGGLSPIPVDYMTGVGQEVVRVTTLRP